MTFLRRLFLGCWWTHSDQRERIKGRYFLVCEQCGSQREILARQKLKVRKLPVKPVLKMARKRA